MSEIQVGDKVRIKKPKNVRDWPTWVPEMDKFEGRVVKIERIGNSAFGKGKYTFFEEDNQWFQFDLKWCEKVEEEMTLAQWEKMSPQERLEWNRPAFEALAGSGVETLYAGSGPLAWTDAIFVTLERPSRPKKKVQDPLAEFWLVVDAQGGHLTSVFVREEDAAEWKDSRIDEDQLRVVKYVIAE